MAPSAEPYRKLPGRLRGFGYGATVWMGQDHLLLARTRLFRETYKRFYLRDVQAIVVAERPRFHLSIRAAALGFLWALTGLFLTVAPPLFLPVYLGVFVALIATWIIVSAAFSCTCRIYTAVSNEELPSLYRTWSARKFLAEVKPLIDEAQGAVEANWIEAVEAHQAGPASAVVAGVQPEAPTVTTPPAGPNQTAIADMFIASLFIASLLIGAILDLFNLHSVTAAVRGGEVVLGLAQVVLAVLVLMQCYRRMLRSAMQKLAIIALVLMGSGYYASMLMATVAGAARPVNTASNEMLMLPQFVLLREIYSGTAILLALTGVLIIVRGAARQPDIIYKEPEAGSHEPQ